MASANQCLASMARLSLSSAARPSASSIPRFLLPSISQTQTRFASRGPKKTERKKNKHKTYKVHNKAGLEQFSLCDAIRYLRAVEVGRPPASASYELAIKLQTTKGGAVIRDRIRLPHPCQSDLRVAVICKENSKVAADARQDGAVAAGEESVFEGIRSGTLDFNRLICHIDSAPALMQARLGPVLGPRGLMPNLKNKTITNDVRGLMHELVGTDNYRERAGVVRLAVGQLGFTPEMVAANVKAFVAKVKADIRKVEEQTPKAVDEIVFSSTNGPGFSLNGSFSPTDEKVTPADLSTVV